MAGNSVFRRGWPQTGLPPPLRPFRAVPGKNIRTAPQPFRGRQNALRYTPAVL